MTTRSRYPSKSGESKAPVQMTAAAVAGYPKSSGGRSGGKKAAYTSRPPIVPFSTKEILAVDAAIPAGGWVRVEKSASEATEAMKANNVEFLVLSMPGYDEKEKKVTGYRPIYHDTTPFRTASRCLPGVADEGKMASAMIFQTRIRKVPTDKKEQDEYFESKACDVVNLAFPGVSDEEFSKRVDQQKGLLIAEHQQERAFAILAREIERAMNDEKTQEAIGWSPKKTQTIRGNVQYEREWNAESDKGTPKPKSGLIPLDEPIVRFRIQADKKKNPGELWCKFFDASKPVEKGRPRPIVEVVTTDSDGKVKKSPLDYFNIEEWFRPESLVVGRFEHQICLCKDGAIHHAKAKELNIKRSAKKTGSAPAIKDDSLSSMADYGGQFDDGSDVPAEKPAAGGAAGTAGASAQTAIEKEFENAIGAGGDDD